MNFQEFSAFKEEIAAERDLARFDCMNPFKAMQFLKTEFTPHAARSSDDVLDIWADTMGMQNERGIALASGGVRQSLTALFNIYSAQNTEVWLPEDVYPFYWDTALSAGLTPRSFPTLPSPDFLALNQAADQSVMLITNPISPLGRHLNAQETAEIKTWLSGAKDRRVILDTVYTYTRGFDAHSLDLYSTGQCIIAHSLSKAWLERGVFGVLLAPEQDRAACKARLNAPDAAACASAHSALAQQVTLADKQQAAFTREWARLTPAIKRIDPNFTAPNTGYFTAINADYRDALDQHNSLIIPASVFGSRRKDVSIVSCLYDIAR